MNILLNTHLISNEQYKSLTRKYKDIQDLKSEEYEQKNWKIISSMQKEATKKQEQEVQL